MIFSITLIPHLTLAEAASEDLDLFACEWRMSGVENEIYLNGALLHRGTNGGGGGSCTGWTVNGKNRVEVKITKVLSTAPRLTFSLRQGKVMDPSNLKTIEALAVDWKPTGKERFPVTVVKEAEVHHALGQWLWEKSTPLKDDEATRKEIFKHIETLYQIVRAGDAKGFLKYASPAIEESGRAYGHPEAKALFEESIRQILKKRPDLGKPVYSDFRFRLCANGHLMHVTRRDGSRFLRIPETKSSFFSPPSYFGLSQGSWIFMGE